MKIGKDLNGNKTVKITVPWAKGFSIQTNGNLPITHRTNTPHYNEIAQHVAMYGTNHQKNVMAV